MNIDLNILLSLCNKKDMPILVGYKTFLNHISEFKNIETYKYHHAYYRSFIPFMEKEHLEKISQLDNLIILKYIDYCKTKGNKNSTINKKIGSLKYMLNYLEKMQLIDKPKINIEKLPNDEERYKDLTKDQIFKILEFSRTLEPKRHLQILLFLFTGIRRTELCHILLENIKPDYIILTHTKNKKPRNIYLNEEMVELIEEIKKENKIYLFENMKHTEHENPRTLENLFKAIEDKTGIHTSPHCLRHTFATQLLEKGADLESIRLLLGHSDYSMIMRYVHIKNKRLAEMSTNLYDLERMDKQVQ